MKLFVNRKLDFSGVEDVIPTQVLEIPAGEDLVIPLRYVLFQRVTSLTLFIEDNAGADVTAISNLQVRLIAC